MANITFNLPDLPDNDVWWANNAAWQAYWNNQTITVDVDAATTGERGVVLQAATTVYTAGGTGTRDYVNLVIDGVGYIVPLQSSFDELRTAFVALNADYMTLKTALVAAGVINNA